MMSLSESPLHVSVTVHVNPEDIVSGLNGNDDAVLQFICQLVALCHSSDLREDLLHRLGLDFEDRGDGFTTPVYDPTSWQDEDYLPSESESERAVTAVG